jgi:hypothetical protein
MVLRHDRPGAGQDHRVTIAPDATGADLGQALRQVIERELALYP